jgi:alpha-N-arabinofuranosidase
MANYAQTVNVIGAIKTTPTAAEMEATGLVLALYRREFGTLPLNVVGVPAALDVVAALTPERDALTVAIVNPTDGAQRLTLDLKQGRLTGQARRFVLTGADRWAHNAPGQPRGVTVSAVSLTDAGPQIDAPPLSVTLERRALR